MKGLKGKVCTISAFHSSECTRPFSDITVTTTVSYRQEFGREGVRTILRCDLIDSTLTLEDFGGGDSRQKIAANFLN